MLLLISRQFAVMILEGFVWPILHGMIFVARDSLQQAYKSFTIVMYVRRNVVAF